MRRKKGFFKRHLGLIILILCVLAFPNGIDVQARLNMRIIVTGIAVDFEDDKYEVTAQYVKTSGSEVGGNSATVDFLSDSADSVQSAISKLSYKSGKIAGFSHTSFIILGKNLSEKSANECLDFFVRSRIIESSAMILVASDKACDLIKKTQNLELSVGVGLQKVFLSKELQGDGVMTTVVDFLKNSLSASKTACASVLEFDESSESQGEGSGEQSESGGSSSAGGGNETSSSDSQKSSSVFFKPKSKVACFVDGKQKCKLESEDEIDGFMLSSSKAKRANLLLKDFSVGRLTGASVGILIKEKGNNLKIDYKDDKPVLKVSVSVSKAEIVEVFGVGLINEFTDDEFTEIQNKIKDDIINKVKKSFNKTKNAGADTLKAYDLALKLNYDETTNNYDNLEDFLGDLTIDVSVSVDRIEY